MIEVGDKVTFNDGARKGSGVVVRDGHGYLTLALLGHSERNNGDLANGWAVSEHGDNDPSFRTYGLRALDRGFGFWSVHPECCAPVA